MRKPEDLAVEDALTRTPDCSNDYPPDGEANVEEVYRLRMIRSHVGQLRRRLKRRSNNGRG